MIRLFVAIALPAAVRARLAGLAGGVPGARWVAPEAMHVTLRFIGEVPDGDLPDLVAALAHVRVPAFALTLAGIGHFGTVRKARALWAGVAPNPALDRLHAAVVAALDRAGVAPVARKYTPHVTLARLKQSPAARLGAFVAAHNLLRVGPVPVDDFSLFSSHLSHDGARHRVEATFPLEPA